MGLQNRGQNISGVSGNRAGTSLETNFKISMNGIKKIDAEMPELLQAVKGGFLNYCQNNVILTDDADFDSRYKSSQMLLRTPQQIRDMNTLKALPQSAAAGPDFLNNLARTKEYLESRAKYDEFEKRCNDFYEIETDGTLEKIKTSIDFLKKFNEVLPHPYEQLKIITDVNQLRERVFDNLAVLWNLYASVKEETNLLKDNVAFYDPFNDKIIIRDKMSLLMEDKNNIAPKESMNEYLLKLVLHEYGHAISYSPKRDKMGVNWDKWQEVSTNVKLSDGFGRNNPAELYAECFNRYWSAFPEKQLEYQKEWGTEVMNFFGIQ